MHAEEKRVFPLKNITPMGRTHCLGCSAAWQQWCSTVFTRSALIDGHLTGPLITLSKSRTLRKGMELAQQMSLDSKVLYSFPSILRNVNKIKGTASSQEDQHLLIKNFRDMDST